MPEEVAMPEIAPIERVKRIQQKSFKYLFIDLF